ncbi:MAG: tetratricopeptide repeat protein [Lysobacterales bacterium]
MSILGEMKRRNVFRIGMVYIVASWVIIQIGDIIAKNFGAPEWVMGVVITFVISGLPIALFLAWTFALTTDGLRKESDLLKVPTLTRTSGDKLDYITMALLAVIVGMVALDRYMPVPEIPQTAGKATQVVAEPEEEEPVVIVENSIAVLPFVNMSAEPNQDYFSDGLSEELLNVLTHVDGLVVASRTSSFAYKNDSRNIKQIARSLRVANILEGSVRKVGDRLRITAQLIDTANDRHLWSDTYDRDMDDIFLIQDEIANAIVSALTTELGIGLESVSVDSATSNLDAYDIYLKAREMFIARENLPTSWTLLEQATNMDPQFARAWEALAAVHSVATSWDRGDGMDHDALALAAAHRALEIDPDLSMPYAVIGLKFNTTGEGYAGAIRNLDTAIEKDPKNATAWLWRGITFKDMGYFDKAISDFERCLEIDPAYLLCSQYLASGLLYSGQIESAVRQFEKTIEYNFHALDDQFVSYYVRTGQRNMAYLIGTLGLQNSKYVPVREWVDAIENPLSDHAGQVARFNQWGASNNIDICDMETAAVALRQDQCFASVENAGLQWHPDAAYYRKTPAFKAYVNAHLRDYWQQNGPPPQCRLMDDGEYQCD